MLVRLKLGFEPIQNRSGLKKRPQRVRSVLCLHSPIPSIHPRGVHSALRPHAEHELACMQKERKDCAQKILSFGRLCSRSNFTSTSKTTNRPLQGFTSTREHLLNQLTLFTKEQLKNFCFSSRWAGHLLHPGCSSGCFSNVRHLKRPLATQISFSCFSTVFCFFFLFIKPGVKTGLKKS